MNEAVEVITREYARIMESIKYLYDDHAITLDTHNKATLALQERLRRARILHTDANELQIGMDDSKLKEYEATLK